MARRERPELRRADAHQRANPGFSIQTGEQRSQGVEVSAQARIVSGWDVLAFYADVDAEITEDTNVRGRQPAAQFPAPQRRALDDVDVPERAPEGARRRFGLRYVGERPVDLGYSLTLSDYVVLGPALFYRRGRLSVDLNFKNVTDETYFNGNGTFVSPGEPFSVLGRVAWSF